MYSLGRQPAGLFKSCSRLAIVGPGLEDSPQVKISDFRRLERHSSRAVLHEGKRPRAKTDLKQVACTSYRHRAVQSYLSLVDRYIAGVSKSLLRIRSNPRGFCLLPAMDSQAAVILPTNPVSQYDISNENISRARDQLNKLLGQEKVVSALDARRAHSITKWSVAAPSQIPTLNNHCTTGIIPPFLPFPPHSRGDK